MLGRILKVFFYIINLLFFTYILLKRDVNTIHMVINVNIVNQVIRETREEVHHTIASQQCHKLISRIKIMCQCKRPIIDE